MRFINVRTFVKNFFTEVKDLPVTVTKYGIPIFKVVPINEPSVPPEKILEKIPEGMLVPDKDPEFTETVLCEAPNMKCKDWATKRVHFESPEYEDMTLNFCDKHYKELKKLGADILSEEDL